MKLFLTEAPKKSELIKLEAMPIRFDVIFDQLIGSGRSNFPHLEVIDSISRRIFSRQNI